MLRFALAVSLCAAAINVARTDEALAWSDEGHEVVALVAQSFLEPDVRKRVNALLQPTQTI
jgi:hypothetical protein